MGWGGVGLGWVGLGCFGLGWDYPDFHQRAQWLVLDQFLPAGTSKVLG